MVRAAAAAELLAAAAAAPLQLLLLATMLVGISACTTEEDICSLLGACTAGACIYDAGWTGADCAVLALKHDDESYEDACDKHTGQCCHHACKMTNWNCCHHDEHCCCGGPPQRISNCSGDEQG
jgi:hypothetical protein